MPTFIVSAPNGRKFKIDAPEGATADDAMSYVRRNIGADKLGESNPLDFNNYVGDASPQRGVIDALISGGERSFSRMGSMVTDVIPALYDSAIGHKNAAIRQMQEAADKEAEIQRTNPTQFKSLSDVQGIGDVPAFFAETIGEQGANILASMGTGFAGSMIGQRVALGAAEKTLAANAVGKGLTEEAAKAYAKKGTQRLAQTVGASGAATGANAGVYLGSFAQNAPEVFQNIYDATGEFAPGASLIGGALSGALDMITPSKTLKALGLGNAAQVKAAVAGKLLEKSGMEPSLIRSALSSMGQAAATEGLTESAQEAISIAAEKIVGENYDLWSSKEFNRIIESGVRGAVGGGPFGVVEGIGEYREARSELDKQQDAIRAEENRVAAQQNEAAQAAAKTEQLNTLTTQIADVQNNLAQAKTALDANPFDKRTQYAYSQLEAQLKELTEQQQKLTLTPEQIAANKAKEKEEQAKLPDNPEDYTGNDMLKALGMTPQEAKKILEANKLSINFKKPVVGQTAEDFVKFLNLVQPNDVNDIARVKDDAIKTPLVEDFINRVEMLRDNHPNLSPEAIRRSKITDIKSNKFGAAFNEILAGRTLTLDNADEIYADVIAKRDEATQVGNSEFAAFLNNRITKNVFLKEAAAKDQQGEVLEVAPKVKKQNPFARTPEPKPEPATAIPTPDLTAESLTEKPAETPAVLTEKPAETPTVLTETPAETPTVLTEKPAETPAVLTETPTEEEADGTADEEGADGTADGTADEEVEVSKPPKPPKLTAAEIKAAKLPKVEDTDYASIEKTKDRQQALTHLARIIYETSKDKTTEGFVKKLNKPSYGSRADQFGFYEEEANPDVLNPRKSENFNLEFHGEQKDPYLLEQRQKSYGEHAQSFYNSLTEEEKQEVKKIAITLRENEPDIEKIIKSKTKVTLDTLLEDDEKNQERIENDKNRLAEIADESSRLEESFPSDKASEKEIFEFNQKKNEKLDQLEEEAKEIRARQGNRLGLEKVFEIDAAPFIDQLLKKYNVKSMKEAKEKLNIKQIEEIDASVKNYIEYGVESKIAQKEYTTLFRKLQQLEIELEQIGTPEGEKSRARRLKVYRESRTRIIDEDIRKAQIFVNPSRRFSLTNEEQKLLDSASAVVNESKFSPEAIKELDLIAKKIDSLENIRRTLPFVPGEETPARKKNREDIAELERKSAQIRNGEVERLGLQINVPEELLAKAEKVRKQTTLIKKYRAEITELEKEKAKLIADMEEAEKIHRSKSIDEQKKILQNRITGVSQALESIRQSYDVVDPEDTNWGKMLSVAKKAEKKGSTPVGVREALQQAMGRDVDRITIVQTPKEAGLTNIPTNAKGAVIDNKAYLFTKNIQAGREFGTFLHEMGVHLGMKRLVGEANYNFLSNKIVEWAAKTDNSIESQIAKAALARIPKGVPTIDETIAYFVEEAVDNFGVNPTEQTDKVGPIAVFFRKLMAGIKNILAKFGLSNVEFTSQDIVDLAYGAAHKELAVVDLSFEKYQKEAREITQKLVDDAIREDFLSPEEAQETYNDLYPGILDTVLQDRTKDITNSPNFRQWFKGSKVVNRKGQPLIMYHGTSHNITVFEYKQENSSWENSKDLHAIFLSPSYEFASAPHYTNIDYFAYLDRAKDKVKEKINHIFNRKLLGSGASIDDTNLYKEHLKGAKDLNFRVMADEIDFYNLVENSIIGKANTIIDDTITTRTTDFIKDYVLPSDIKFIDQDLLTIQLMYNKDSSKLDFYEDNFYKRWLPVVKKSVYEDLKVDIKNDLDQISYFANDVYLAGESSINFDPQEFENVKEKVFDSYLNDTKKEFEKRWSDNLSKAMLKETLELTQYGHFPKKRKTIHPNVMAVYVRAENPFDYDNIDHLNAVADKLIGNAEEETQGIRDKEFEEWLENNKESLKRENTATQDFLKDQAKENIFIRTRQKLANKVNEIQSLMGRVNDGEWRAVQNYDVQKAIRELGHDGFYELENRTKNLAVFSGSQIKSAIGNFGTFNETNPDIRYSLAEAANTPIFNITPRLRATDGETRDARNSPDLLGEFESNSSKIYDQVFGAVDNGIKKMPTFTQGALSWARDLLENGESPAKNLFIKLRDMQQFAELAGIYSPEQKGAEKEVRLQSLEGVIREIDRVVRDSDYSMAKEIKKITDFLKTSRELTNEFTQEQMKKFGRLYHASTLNQIDYTNPDNATHPLVLEFRTQDERLQKLHKELYKKYEDYANRQIERLDNEPVLGTAGKLMAKLLSKQIKPYSPLYREGDFWIKFVNPDTNEEDLAAFKTKALRREAIEYLKTKGVKAQEFSRIPNVTVDSLPPTGEVRKIIGLLEKQGVKKDVINNVYQIYLNLFPNSSVMQNFRPRKGIGGFEEDPLLVFANVAPRMERSLGHFEVAKELDSLMGRANGLVGKHMPEPVAAIMDSLESRVNFFRDPVQKGILGNIASRSGQASYYYFLWGNVSSALVQTITLPVVAYPMIGGKYGFDSTAAEFSNAMKLWFKGGRDDNTSTPNPFTGRIMNDKSIFGDRSNLSIEERALYDVAVGRVIKPSIGHDLEDFRNGKLSDVSTKATQVAAWGGWAFQNSERMIREITLLSTYRLARKGNSELNVPAMNHADAVEEAIRMTEKVNGSVSAKVGPQLFQKDIGKIIGTFKRISLAMIYLSYKNFKEAFFDADPKIRRIAKRQFAAINTMAFTFAGIKGVPMYGAASLAASLAGSMFGDDDEPNFSLDRWIKENLPSVFSTGVISEVTGADIAGRSPFSNMLFRSDDKLLEDVGPYLYIIQQASGAPGSILQNTNRGFNMINEGMTYRGMESMMPSFAKNVLKGVRIQVEGATNPRGYKLVDDPFALDGFYQVVGFTPKDISDAYEAAKYISSDVKFASDKRSDILRKANMAKIAGDMEEYNRIKTEDKNKYNQSRLGKLNPITEDSFEDSYRQWEQRINQSMYGFPVPDKYRKAAMAEFGDTK